MHVLWRIAWCLWSLLPGGCEDVTTTTTDLYTTNQLMFFEVVQPEEIHYVFKIRPAKDFGQSFPHPYTNIPLVPGEPYLGCRSLDNSYQTNGAVVLLKRGDCSFITKTRNAEKVGAIAVIIANNNEQDDEEFIDMIQDDTSRDVHIPALFLLGNDGIIKSTLDKLHMTTSALINIPVNITGIPIHQANLPPWTLW